MEVSFLSSSEKGPAHFSKQVFSNRAYSSTRVLPSLRRKWLSFIYIGLCVGIGAQANAQAPTSVVNSVKLGAGGQTNHNDYFEDLGGSAVLSNGSLVSVWRARDNSSATPNSPDGDDYGAYFRILNLNGAQVAGPTAPYLDINPSGTGEQNTPKVAALTGGGFALTWNSNNGPGDIAADKGDTYVRVYTNTGTPVSSTSKVNESQPSGTNDEQLPVDIIALSDGGFAIIWRDDNDNTGNKDDYYVRAYNANGSARGGSVRVGTNHNAYFERFTSLIALDAGKFAVSWSTDDLNTSSTGTAGAEGDLDKASFFRVFNADGTGATGPIRPYLSINATGQGNQSTPILSKLNNGNLAMAWNSELGPGDIFADGGDTYTAVFTPTGSLVGSVTKVNDLQTDNEERPRDVRALTGGGYVVVWHDDEDDPGPNKDDYYVRVYSSTGTAVAASLRISPSTDALFEDFRDVAALSDGGFVVGLRIRDSNNNATGTSADGGGYAAGIRLFNSDGTARTALFFPYLDVNPDGSGSQNTPLITANPAGGFAVSWNSNNNSNDGSNNDLGAGGNNTSGGDTWFRVYSNTGVALSSSTRTHPSSPGEVTGTIDEQIPNLLMNLSSGRWAVVFRDNNRNTDNKDDYYVSMYEVLLPSTNAAPTFNDGDTASLTITENASATSINALLDINDTDNGDTLTWSVTSGPSSGSLSGFDANGSSNGGNVTPTGLTYTPSANSIGNDSFTIEVSDGTDTDSITVTITRSDVNPVITANSGSIAEDASLNDPVLNMVATGDTNGLSWAITAGNTGNAFAINSSGQITVANSLNHEGISSYTLTVTVDDEDAGTTADDSETVTISVTNVDEAPSFNDGATTTLNLNEDATATSINNLLDIADGDNGNPLTWSVSSGPARGALGGFPASGTSNSGTVTPTGLTYSPDLNETGSDSFQIQISDGTDTDTITVNVSIAAVNDPPVLGNLNASPAYTEGNTAIILDGDVTVSDIELDALNSGNGDYSGASLSITRNGGSNNADGFSMVSGGNLSVSGSSISAGGNVIATLTTSLSGVGTLSFEDNGTTPTTALVQEVLQAIRYQNSSNDPAAVVQLNYTFSDGGSGQGAGGAQTDAGSLSVSITNINDAPSLSAAGANPSFLEGGAAQDLFNTVSANTIEASDRFTSLTMTVTNLADASNEILSFDGSDLALVHNNSITTATNTLSVTVSLSGTTATVSFSGASLTSAQLQTLIDALTYRNTSEDPTSAGNRVITVTGISDSGGTDNNGVDSSSPNLSSTVTVTPVNDPPMFGDLDGDTTILQVGASARIDVDGNASVTNPDSDDYDGGSLTLEDNGNNNSASGDFSVDGTTVTSGGDMTLGGGETILVSGITIGSVHPSLDGQGGNTLQITLNSNATRARVEVLLQHLSWGASAGTGAQTFTATLNDADGTANGGVQTGSASFTMTLNNLPALGGAPADVSVPDNVASPINLSAYTITDLDNDSVSLTLAVGEGTIASTDGNGTFSGVSVAGSGTASMTLQGLPANLNSYVDITTKIEYSPVNNSTTSTTLSVTLEDPVSTGTGDTIAITVTAINDQPSATGQISSTAFNDNAGPLSIFDNIVIGDVDAGENDLSIEIRLSNASAGTISGGGFSDQGSGVYRLSSQTPANASSALDSVNFTPTNNSGSSGTFSTSFTIAVNDQEATEVTHAAGTATITRINDAPVNTSPTMVDVAEGSTSVVTLTATDPDDTPGFQIVPGADAGAFTIPTGTNQLEFINPPDFEAPGDGDTNNIYEVQVAATDGLLSDPQTIQVRVTNVNDTPTVETPVADFTVNEDAPDSSFDLTDIFSDQDEADSNLTFSIESNSNPSLVTAQVDNGTDTLTLDFLLNQHGSTEITIRATDSGALWVEESFMVTVTPVNDPPTVSNAVPDISVPQNAPNSSLSLTDIFSDIEDADGDLNFSVTSNTNPTLVTPDIDAGTDILSLEYLTGQSGTTVLTIRATDSGNLFIEDQFTVEVTKQVDMIVEVVESRDPVLAGSGSSWNLIHQIRVRNAGPSDATTVVVDFSQTLPANVTLHSMTPSSGQVTGTTWSIPIVPVGNMATLTMMLYASGDTAGGTDVVVTSASLTSSAEPTVNPGNDAAEVKTSITSPESAGITLNTGLVGNLSNFLIEQRVTITNNNPDPIPSLRILVGSLPADVILFNRSGIAQDGRPYIVYTQNIPPGETVSILFQYFRNSGLPNFSPVYTVEILSGTAAQQLLNPQPSVPFQIDLIERQPDDSILLEWPTVSGKRYYIQYTTDLINYITVLPAIDATTARSQWFDMGAPETESHPVQTEGLRIYRIVEE